MKKICLLLFIVLLLFSSIIYLAPGPLLRPLAEFLINDDPPREADVALVLNTGMGIYERLIEAANLYNQGYVKEIIINGNRKNPVLTDLERMKWSPCCPWNEEYIRVLELFGVPRTAVNSISAPDVYDTITEAETIGTILSNSNIQSIIITTSKTHTARALYIWRDHFADRFQLISVTAKQDSFNAQEWWKSGKDIKSLMYEYGSWIYLLWEKFTRNQQSGSN